MSGREKQQGLQRGSRDQRVLAFDITVCRDTICSGLQSGLASRLHCEALKGGLAAMSNEKETKRPLDTEKLSETQMDGIAGGLGESDSEKVRFNSACINSTCINSACINMSDCD